MLNVILWKEWRQQAALVIAILALAGIGLTSTALWMGQEWDRGPAATSPRIVWVWLLILLAVTQGLVTGALLFAGETEDNTQEFLDQHSGLRSPIWSAKMVAGASLVGVSSLIFAGLIVGLRLGTLLHAALCVWFAFDALAWTAACAPGRRSTFGAIGVAIVVLLLVAAMPFYIKVPIIVLALSLSWYRYCEPDLARYTAPAQRSFLTPHRTWFGWLQVSLWHIWARRKGTLFAMTIGSLVAGYMAISKSGVYHWPIGSFLLGCVAGWAVFADEKGLGAERFLGDLRLPRGRLWAGKTLPFFVLVLGSAVLALLVAIITVSPMGHSRLASEEYLFFPQWMIEGLAFIPYVFTFAVYGFAAAVFATQRARNMPVAIFLTLAFGGLTAAAWFPSLVQGMAAWRVWLAAAAILLATLAWLPRWMTGRLYDRRGIVQLVGFLATIGLWLAGNLWWRATELPDPGEPFDTTAYAAEFFTAPAPHGEALLLAAEGLEKRYDEAEARFPVKYDEDGRPVVGDWWNPSWGPFDWSAFRHVALQGGIPVKPGLYEDYVDFLFQGDWAKSFADAALAPPDRLPRRVGQSYSRAYDELYIGLFLIRSQLHLRAGRAKEALGDLDLALGGIRHGLHRSWGRYLDQSLSWHRLALENAQRLFVDGPDSEEFRAGLADLLARHERLLPSFAENVKSSYVFDLDKGAGWFPQASFQRELLDHAPWEKERDVRMKHIAYAMLLKNAQSGRFPTYFDNFAVFQSFFGPPPYLFRDGGFRAEFWTQHRFGHQLGLSSYNPLISQSLRFADELSVLRRLRLGLAAADFAAKKGRPIEALAELVPDFVDQLPVNPYIEKPIRMGAALANEEIEMGTHRTIQTSAGQVLILSGQGRGRDGAQERPVVVPLAKVPAP
jgi:hypothetical protein